MVDKTEQQENVQNTPLFSDFARKGNLRLMTSGRRIGSILTALMITASSLSAGIKEDKKSLFDTLVRAKRIVQTSFPTETEKRLDEINKECAITFIEYKNKIAELEQKYTERVGELGTERPHTSLEHILLEYAPYIQPMTILTPVEKNKKEALDKRLGKTGQSMAYMVMFIVAHNEFQKAYVKQYWAEMRKFCYKKAEVQDPEFVKLFMRSLKPSKKEYDYKSALSKIISIRTQSDATALAEIQEEAATIRKEYNAKLTEKIQGVIGEDKAKTYSLNSAFTSLGSNFVEESAELCKANKDHFRKYSRMKKEDIESIFSGLKEIGVKTLKRTSLTEDYTRVH